MPPDSIADIAERLGRRYLALLRSSLVEAIRRRLAEAEAELREVKARLEELQRRHNTSLADFERSMGDSLEEHEAWIEWKFLQEAEKSLEKEIDGLRQLPGKALREVQEHNS